MASSLPLKVVFGGVMFANADKMKSADDAAPFFNALDRQGVDTIDTAQLYGAGRSESFLGSIKAGDKYTFDTKWLGGWEPGSTTKDNIVESAKDSVKKLGVKQVDIFYLHAPDKDTPVPETLEGVNEAYNLGLFKRFGLSNFSTEQVQEVYDVAKSKGYVLPTVYQGNYSAVTRIPESTLFPLLRKLSIAIYAYSPLAGGLLTKSASDLGLTGDAASTSRFAKGSLYGSMYDKPAYHRALEQWEAIAKEEGIDRAELGFRWIGWHSALDGSKGDALVVGASRPEQLEKTVEALRKGKLSDKAVKDVGAVWEEVKGEAPVDNFTK